MKTGHPRSLLNEALEGRDPGRCCRPTEIRNNSAEPFGLCRTLQITGPRPVVLSPRWHSPRENAAKAPSRMIQGISRRVCDDHHSFVNGVTERNVPKTIINSSASQKGCRCLDQRSAQGHVYAFSAEPTNVCSRAFFRHTNSRTVNFHLNFDYLLYSTT